MEPAELPETAAIAAAVSAREERTFPCEFESSCEQTVLGHDGAAARWSERLWIGARLRVLRILPEPSAAGRSPVSGDRAGVEAIEAFDGARLVVATRNLPRGRWHGSVRRSSRWVAPGRALAGFFLLGPERLGAALSDGSVTVHGWTAVDGVRCVLLEVARDDGRRAVFALDPAREHLPLAVWIPASEREERTGDSPRTEVRIPFTRADGAAAELSLRIVRAFSAMTVDTLEPGRAPYPSRVRSAHDTPGGVHFEAVVRPQDGRDGEALAGTEGDGLAGLMPEGGSLFDAERQTRVSFGSDAPAPSGPKSVAR